MRRSPSFGSLPLSLKIHGRCLGQTPGQGLPSADFGGINRMLFERLLIQFQTQARAVRNGVAAVLEGVRIRDQFLPEGAGVDVRSEERRVGKECL